VIRPPQYSIEQVKGGFAVCRRAFRKNEYVGIDGYWSNRADAIQPFETPGQALRYQEWTMQFDLKVKE
jgi:hypothetical protein